ncbi:MAG: serine/threonine kinase PknH [Mycobacterium sp.]|nr:serine/threonine kinase PknH [Mycobacterium sp.]
MGAVPRQLNEPLVTGGPARRTGKTRLFAGAIALAALVALGTLGVALGGTPGPSVISVKNVATSTISTTSTIFSTPPTPPSSATSTAPAAPTDTSTSTSTTETPLASTTETPPAPSPLDKLYSVLPPGYNSTLCGPSANPSPQALATVDCGQLDQASGPTSARFSLFADANSLASQFQDGVNEAAVSQCPGSIDTPRSWHYDATPAFSAGSLACGTRNNVPDLMWTKNDVLLLGDVQGADLDSLYGWWLSLG